MGNDEHESGERFMVKRSQPNFKGDGNSTRHFVEYWALQPQQSRIVPLSQFPTEVTSVKYTSISPSSALQANVRKVDEKEFFEIWDGCHL